MSDLVPIASGALDRTSRQAARALIRSRSSAQFRAGRVDHETDVTMAKADALSATTGAAMQAIVRVAQAQRQLEQLMPEAATRLNFLADDHALTMSELLSDLRRELRRK